MNDSASISIIISTANRPQMLWFAVESVVNQSCRPTELVIVDDASREPLPMSDIADACQRVGIKLTAERNSESQGPSACRNQGVRLAGNSVVGFLDDDDMFLPHHVSTHMALFERTASACLVTSGICAGDWHGEAPRAFFASNRINGLISGRDLLFANLVGAPSNVTMFREVFLLAGGFDETIPALEDYEFWLRIAQDHELLGTSEVTVRYNLTLAGKTSRTTRNATARDDAQKEIRRRYGAKYSTLSTVERRRAFANLVFISHGPYANMSLLYRIRLVFRVVTWWPLVKAMSLLVAPRVRLMVKALVSRGC